MKLGTGTAALGLALVVLWTSAARAAPCAGDCDGSGAVTIEELVTAVHIALGQQSAAICPAVDADGDERVTVDEIVRAVRMALEGCPLPIVHYDREDPRRTNPFPDDFWLVDDPEQRTGVRLSVQAPPSPSDVAGILRLLLRETNRLDGFSPIAHFVLELSEAPDPDTVPLTPAESLQPGASVGLFDLTPGSPIYGQRVPIRVLIRDDVSVLGVRSHSLLIFPSISLTPRGRYGLVVSSRLHTLSGQPFRASAFFRRARSAPLPGESDAVGKVRALSDEVLSGISRSEPDIQAQAILAVRISVRSMDDIPSDLLAVKEQVLAAPPPTYEIQSVEEETNPASPIAAVVRGVWRAPDWRDGLYLSRDAGGRPQITKTNSVRFSLALPRMSFAGPVPITMYQHGNPGSAEREVPSEAREYLAEAGFAVAGFTDNLNREVSAGISNSEEAVARQVTAVFFALVQDRRIPDYWVELNAEQIAFVRLLGSLGSLDVLPVGAPDGVPELDPSQPLTYVGISQGANYAPGLLPYAPEIKAAALVVGGARLMETLIHQRPDDFVRLLGQVFPNMTPADIWMGLSLFQHNYDRQDAHNHARFLYREPLLIHGTTGKASILLIEGIDDSLVPNHATDALAWLIGLPHLRPVQRAIPFLSVADPPVRGNIDAATTGGFYQYVPVGVPGLPPTPGCRSLTARIGSEGHYCAQAARESQRQRAIFLRSALSDGPPEIVDPLTLP